MSEKLVTLLSKKQMKEVDHWISKYPDSARPSAVLSTLHIVQETHGYLTTAMMDAVADYLHMPAIAVYEVASFYTMYETQPIGKHLINVCTNISCQLMGCKTVVTHLEKKLKIRMGETTADGRFTLRPVECLAACVNAPVMQVGKTYHEHLTPESIDKILEDL